MIVSICSGDIFARVRAAPDGYKASDIVVTKWLTKKTKKMTFGLAKSENAVHY